MAMAVRAQAAVMLLALFAGIAAVAAWLGESHHLLPCTIAGPYPIAMPRLLYEARLPPAEEEFYSWTWADAGKNLLGHELAEMDPFRWSDWMNAEAMRADLEAYKSPSNNARDVEVIEKSANSQVAFGGNNGKSTVFSNLDAAIRYFGKFTSTPVPPTTTFSSESRFTTTPVPPTTTFSSESSFHRILAAAGGIAVTALCFLGFMSCRSRLQRKEFAVDGDEEDEEHSSDDDCREKSASAKNDFLNRAPQPYQNTYLQHATDALHENELKILLCDIGEAEPVPALEASASKPTSASEAAREVERILSVRNPREIFGGSLNEHRSEYRRLVRMLHPDKRVISGERATLALRRVVEAHNALEAAGK